MNLYFVSVVVYQIIMLISKFWFTTRSYVTVRFVLLTYAESTEYRVHLTNTFDVTFRIIVRIFYGARTTLHQSIPPSTGSILFFLLSNISEVEKERGNKLGRVKKNEESNPVFGYYMRRYYRCVYYRIWLKRRYGLGLYFIIEVRGKENGGE